MKPATGFELPQLREDWRDEAAGTVLDLTVRRGGGTKDVKSRYAT